MIDDITRICARCSANQRHSSSISTSLNISQLDSGLNSFPMFSSFDSQDGAKVSLGGHSGQGYASAARGSAYDSVEIRFVSRFRFASLSGGAAGSKGAVQNAEDPRPSC